MINKEVEVVVRPNNKEAVKKTFMNAKGKICAEFEKVCMTDLAFKRMKKEMHDIFDQMEVEIQRYVK